MELDHYLESVRRSVENATALADDQTRSVAQRLGATLDDAGRLALISALSDAAGEISRELSPGSVELRMAGGRPEFVVTPAPSQLTGPDETDDDIDDETDTEVTEQVHPGRRRADRADHAAAADVGEEQGGRGRRGRGHLLERVADAHRDDRAERPPPRWPPPAPAAAPAARWDLRPGRTARSERPARTRRGLRTGRCVRPRRTLR